MWPIFPAHLTLLVISVMLILVLFAMRIVQPAWWKSRSVRIGVYVAFWGMLSGIAIWGLGRLNGHLGAVHAGAGIAYVGVLVLLPAAVVMPFGAAVDRALVPSDAGTKLSRRALFRLGGASLPAMAAVGGASGFLEAKRDPVMRVVRLRFPGLHPDLEGLRILQLSDVHLGASLDLGDLERGLAAACAKQRPDLIVLTGDLADDPSLIPGALSLVTRANARYGAVASLGNHEYLHGIDVTRPLYEASPVPLLVGDGRSVKIGRATLFIGGADDPVHMGGDIPWFLTPSIEAAAAMIPDDADFRLLLCHRPEGHGPAAENGFDLTLSGHTHGGQLGMFGRSLLEKIKPGIGWWGSYTRKGKRGPSRLYTTSGFGHWFPFRLGCPTEMPLIVLESAPSSPHVASRS